ncbi:sensor histidine kinase [Roseateles sp. YR242]|uniref:sensor histidine kinase n=1 Tax=Roseateles sp. YR242 TaxID=1855305 RepID=UPI000B81593D|nr:sensor histidine kinase [Roseateles sp. YR242]
MNPARARLSLSQQFLLVSFPILLATTVLLGWWVGRQVHESVVHRIGADTALYVDGFIAPQLQHVDETGHLTDAEQRALFEMTTDAEWARRIVSLRIWRPDGMVLFSSDGQGVGQKLDIDEGLEAAVSGSIFSEVSVRRGRDQTDHGQPLERMIETYTPIHTSDRGHIGAVAEFYQLPDEVDREAGAAQRRSWGVVAGAMLATYLLLFVLVRRGSRTIAAQRSALSAQVVRLTELNQQNLQLHGRVRSAAREAVVVHEALLQRISANVHDGPCQDLGFALMQLRNLHDRIVGRPGASDDDVERISHAVEAAMNDLRAIAANLELPDIEPLSLAEVAQRVVRDFVGKTRQQVALTTDVLPGLLAHARIKTTLYRLLQESLANAWRHAPGSECRVDLKADTQRVVVEVTDAGPGFDVAAALAGSRLGLNGMRQRVESLGGGFEIHSERGRGTTVRVSLPMADAELDTPTRPGSEPGR